MPFEHTIDHEACLAVIRGTRGGSMMREMADSAHRLLEDTSIGTDYSFMFVANDIAFHPTPDQMWSIVSLLEMMLSRFSGRMAAVISEVGSVTAANLIAFAADKTGGRLRVFPSEDQAREWLLQRSPTEKLKARKDQ